MLFFGGGGAKVRFPAYAAAEGRPIAVAQMSPPPASLTRSPICIIAGAASLPVIY